jgi:hypothetical protein
MEWCCLLRCLEVEFVDGVIGGVVVDKAIPTTPGNNRMSDGVVGCWRAHMNVIQEYLFRNHVSYGDALLIDFLELFERISHQL